jgi:ubiquinone/menaquinone biosynthesis C-methylase UbiE
MRWHPRLYHWFVRPKWVTKRYIHDHITNHFPLNDKNVLDFGSGTGANCCMCEPHLYLGIEPDSHRVEFAKRLYPSHHFEKFDMKQIPVDKGQMDYILIISVLHHINSDHIRDYMREFRRVLKPDGKIIGIEPYFFEKTPISNLFMQLYDNGNYIRHEQEYIELFNAHFKWNVIKKFKKCFLYNEMFFSASPLQGDMLTQYVPVFMSPQESAHQPPSQEDDS